MAEAMSRFFFFMSALPSMRDGTNRAARLTSVRVLDTSAGKEDSPLFPESLGPLGESKPLMSQAPTEDRSKPDLGLRPWQRLSVGWHAS